MAREFKIKKLSDTEIEFTQTVTKERKDNVTISHLKNMKENVEKAKSAELAKIAELNANIADRDQEIADIQAKIDEAIALGVTEE